MYLLPLPAFTDNYIWMLHDGQRALVVDPGDSTPVLQALEAHTLELQAILVTHHHRDHTGAVAPLQARTGARVWGPAHESLALDVPVTPVQGGDTLELLGCTWQVLDLPGHTAGHIGFYSADADPAPLLFCGDTLFSGGCGRIFEGTPLQMLTSLDKLATLPEHARVCCAHEYTLSNLRFAQAVEPHNHLLARYLAQCQQQRGQGQPTLPSTIGHERAINPFLRTRCPGVIAAACLHNPDTAAEHPSAVLATLREWKNQFS